MYNNQASEIAYNYIVQKIRSGSWNHGDKISTELLLVEEIGVSKVAVRNAIERLVALSILNKIQGSGTYVQEKENMSIMSALVLGCNKEYMMKVLEFRRLFDSYNTELFISNATDDEISLLEINYAQMKLNKDDELKFHMLDYQFHDIIATGTKNPLIKQISNLFVELFIDNQKLLYSNTGPDRAIHYHGQILDAIKDKNQELASLYSKLSIEESIKYIDGESKESIW